MNASFPFDRQKATESAAEFIRLAGGKLNVLKLTKLMYLLDRESLKSRGVPVVGGRYVSMKHGPVTSQVLDAINHKNGEGEGSWKGLITERGMHDLAVKRMSDHDHLAPFELKLIAEIHATHQDKDQFQLRDWCHDNCKEWTKPGFFGGSPPIVFEALAPEIKRTPEELENISREARFMDQVFAMA